MNDRTLVLGGSIQITTRVLSLAMAAALTPLLARRLGADGYGTYTLAMTIVPVAAAIGDVGLGILVGRELIATTDRRSWLRAFWTARAYFALGATAVAALAVAFFEQRTLLWIAVAGIPGAMAVTAVVALFTADLSPSRAAVVETVTRLALVLGLAAAIVAGADVLGVLIVSSVLALASGGLSLRYAARHGVGPLGRGDWKPMMHRALPLATLPIMGIVYSRSDTFVLAALRESSEVGMYGVVWKILEAWMILIGVVAGIGVPVFARSKSPESVRLAARAVGVASLVGGMATAVLARPVIAAVGGVEFLEPVAIGQRVHSSATALMVVMAAFGLMGFNIIAGSALVSFSLERILVRHFVIVVTINLGLAIFLVPGWTFVGAAVASLVSEVVALIHVVWSARRHFVVVDASALGWAVMAVALAGAISYPFREVPPFVGLVMVPSVVIGVLLVVPVRTWLREALDA